jgi:hypothetical protein
VDEISAPLRRELLAYLLSTSYERAELLAQLYLRRSEMDDLLAELEADEDLRARFEIELVRHA